MRKGFTILELLVASLLLGMLVTILTMIFNQSSIAWRTGVAGVADLDEVRENMAALREEADSVYLWNNEMHRLVSLWDDDGNLRTRAISTGSENSDVSKFLAAKASGVTDKSEIKETQKLISVGSGNGGSGINTYTVNVKSMGPDGELGTWDDIWSFPDDFEDNFK